MLVAMTIGLGGTTGVSAVFAVDPPSTVAVSGTLVDQAGISLPGVHLVITEELPPDGGFAGFQARTGTDGSFSATLFAWGTADVPAEVRINAPQGESITLVIDDPRQLALGDPATAPKSLDLVATSTVLGEACGTTATPPTNAGTGNTRGPATQVTPPPTDGRRPVAAVAEDRIGPALALGFIAGVIGAAAFLVPRPKAPRRH